MKLIRGDLYLFPAFIWLFPSILPYILHNLLYEDILGTAHAPSLSIKLFAIIQIILAIMIEYGLFILVTLAIARYSKKIAQKLLIISFGLLSSAYMLFLLLSWAKYFRYGTMLFPTDITFITYLFERVTFEQYLSTSDLFSLAIIGSIVLLMIFKQVYSIKDNANKFNFHALLYGSTLALISQLVIAVGASFSFSTESISKLAQYMAYNTIPQGPILSGALYASVLRTYTVVDLPPNPYTPYQLPTDIRPTTNVIIIAVEALRYDAVFESNEFSSAMPFIRKIADSGVSFSNAYAQATDTEYSLATILSGLYPLKYPVRRRERSIDYPSLSLPSLFKRIGHKTAMFTVFDWANMRKNAEQGGFDLYSDPTVDGGGYAVEKALSLQRSRNGKDSRVDRQEVVARLDQENIRRLIEWAKLEENTPFFAMLYMYDSHFPYTIPSAEYSPLKQESATYFFPPEMAAYYKEQYLAALKVVDQRIEQLFEKLNELNLLTDTIIVITGDHGEQFYEHGGCLHVGQLHQEVLHVPLIFSGIPKECKLEADKLAGHIDIAPTLLRALGLQAYQGYQGIDLCRENETTRVLFSSSQALTDEDALYWSNYKYVRNYRGGGERLFDLKADPAEQNNLIELHESQLIKQFRETLYHFRSAQFSYYALDSKIRKENFPAKFPTGTAELQLR